MCGKNRKKRAYLIYAIVSLIICLCTLGMLFMLPFGSILSPKKLNSLSEISTSDNYVILSEDNLCYTGIDYKKNNHIKGSYYYVVDTKRCYIFLLLPNGNNRPAKQRSFESEHFQVLADDTVLTDLLSSMAKNIDWTTAGLEKITAPFILRETGHRTVNAAILAVILCLFSITSLGYFVYFFHRFLKRRNVTKKAVHHQSI